MNKVLIIITIALLVAGGGVYYYLNKKEGGGVVIKERPTTVIVNTSQLPSSAYSNTEEENVVKDFKVQISGGNSLTLDKPVISSNYAIQTWSDENKGGQALLKYNPSQGWVLLTMGGGVWSVEDLTKIGVPKVVANQLLK